VAKKVIICNQFHPVQIIREFGVGFFHHGFSHEQREDDSHDGCEKGFAHRSSQPAGQ